MDCSEALEFGKWVVKSDGVRFFSETEFQGSRYIALGKKCTLFTSSAILTCTGEFGVCFERVYKFSVIYVKQVNYKASLLQKKHGDQMKPELIGNKTCITSKLKYIL